MSPAPGPEPRRIVLCADDFGMEPSVNEGILRLAAAGRLTAVTCMVDMPAWRDGAPLLPGWRAGSTPGCTSTWARAPRPELLALALRSASEG